MHSWSSHSGLYSFFPLVATLSFWYNIMIKVNQHALINLVYSYMVTKVFNIQPVLFHQYYLCHILWFKKQSFTSVWKPNPPATMCCGSAACRRRLAQVWPRQFFFTGGGGGVVRLTAKPRYLLLLHRGKEKSNTVTALQSADLVSIWLETNTINNS